MSAKRGPGRPRKPAAEKLGEQLLVRMSSAEKKSLEDVAASCGLSSADYLRRAAAYCRALAVPLARVTVGPLSHAPVPALADEDKD